MILVLQAFLQGKPRYFFNGAIGPEQLTINSQPDSQVHTVVGNGAEFLFTEAQGLFSFAAFLDEVPLAQDALDQGSACWQGFQPI